MKHLIYKIYFYTGIIMFLSWIYVSNSRILGRYYHNHNYFIFGLFFLVYLLAGILLYTIDSGRMLFSRNKSVTYAIEQKLFIVGIASTISFFITTSHWNSGNEQIIINRNVFIVLLIINLITYFKVKILRSYNSNNTK
jgi:hypothetical protein